MEIKKHHHTIPVILIVATVLTLSVLATSRLTIRQYVAVRALTTQVIDIHVAKDGVAKISVRQPPTLQANLNWIQTGEEASMLINL